MKPPHATSFQILDADGGWLTVAGIAVAGDLNPKTVDRCLYRWRQHGFVESRIVESGERPWRSRRLEWRTL